MEKPARWLSNDELSGSGLADVGALNWARSPSRIRHRYANSSPLPPPIRAELP